MSILPAELLAVMHLDGFDQQRVTGKTARTDA
jgi:hypothetical protein